MMERIGEKEAAIISNFQSRILDFQKPKQRDLHKKLQW